MRRLGGSLPVVISAEDWETTAEEIDDLFIGDAGICRDDCDPSFVICLDSGKHAKCMH